MIENEFEKCKMRIINDAPSGFTQIIFPNSGTILLLRTLHLIFFIITLVTFI